MAQLNHVVAGTLLAHSKLWAVTIVKFAVTACVTIQKCQNVGATTTTSAFAKAVSRKYMKILDACIAKAVVSLVIGVIWWKRTSLGTSALRKIAL